MDAYVFVREPPVGFVQDLSVDCPPVVVMLSAIILIWLDISPLHNETSLDAQFII